MTDWKLRKHPRSEAVPGPVLIVVIDGVGCGASNEGDAVWLARTPTLDRLAEEALSTRLRAHGTAVGLPSVLVPFPFAADNHQEENAKVLVEAGAAVMYRQADWSPQGVAEWLAGVAGQPQRLEEMNSRKK